MPKRSKKARHLAEYAGARTCLALMDHLPLRWSCAIAWAAADAGFLAAASRRRIAVRNLMESGIAPGKDDARRIARASFRHLAVLAVESFRLQAIGSAERLQEHFTASIPPDTRALLDDPSQGIILVSGHLGNWEVAARFLSTMKPVVGIARAMNNPYVEALMTRRTRGTRFRTLPKHSATPVHFPRLLKQGNILAILIDQHARRGGVMVDFFGRPASCHRSAAVLHLITRAPLCLAYSIRTGPMRFHLTFLPPFYHEPTGNKKADVKTILLKLNRDLESAIRRFPDQYLWAHRRWRAPSTHG